MIVSHPESQNGSVRSPAVRGQRVRTRRVAGLLAAATCSLGLVWPTPVQAALASPVWTVAASGHQASQWQIRESSYTLSLPTRGYLLTVHTARGAFQAPLESLVGRRKLPAGTSFTAAGKGSTLTVTALSSTGVAIEQTAVSCWPKFFTVRFKSQLGSDPKLEPAFFDTGSRGLPVSGTRSGFTPDPIGLARVANPSSFLGYATHTHSAPFSPPAFDLEGLTDAGWAGFGLTEMPDATWMTLDPDDGLLVNYPLRLLARIGDRGAGGTTTPVVIGHSRAAGQWLSFPAFVVTLAASPLRGLVAYHRALTSLHLAPVAAPPGHRPGWWVWPLADTWGQQQVTGAARTSAAYTAAWVRGFAHSWRTRFGLRHFTVVIDAQWQAHLGAALPSKRFGGMAGMRRLIQNLHHQGLRVMLWWPLWVSQPRTGIRGRVDPTAVSFPKAIRNQMAMALGRGPGGLGADGLKLDWGDLVPDPLHSGFARPQLGVGAASLLRYMTMLSEAAWRADPHALIDGSAVAPQFGGTEDAIRLYDAHRDSTWNARAVLVSALDPGTLIDGDGWRLDAAQAVAHLVSSAVFGIPAVYYSTTWSGGGPIRPDFGHDLGVLLTQAEGRGQGTAMPTSDGGWQYVVEGRVTAQTLGHDTALVVFHYPAAGSGPTIATVISMQSGLLSLRLARGWVPQGRRTRAGAPLDITRHGSLLQVRLEGGDSLRLRRTGKPGGSEPSASPLAAF